MPRMAFVRDGVAVNVAPAGQLDDMFHPDVASLFEEVPGQVEVGWRRDNEGHWHGPPDPEPDA